MVVFTTELSAQQFNNWYFPQFAGITFNTNPPSAVTDGLITFTNGFSCASISNNLGQLLFYSDGVQVWNKNHQVMPNGIGLYGGGSQVNSVLIVPFPGDDSKYYLFTAQGWYGGNVGAPLGCRYSVLDMSLDSGRGDITQKNISLLNASFEKITAISGADGSSVWVIFKGAANLYHSFKVTCAGIVSAMVTSSVGLDLTLNPYFPPGDIKSSPDGNYTISDFRGSSNYFDILKFDKNTGIYNQALTLRIPGFQSSGVEFSPNSKLAYLSGVSTTTGLKIYQIKVDVYDSATIINSAQLIYDNSSRGIGALQLGPDNKIYHASCGNYGYLDQINFPNVTGIGCGFQTNSIYLNGSLTACRLPYSFVNLIANQNVQIPTYTIAADCRTVTLTGKTYIRGNNLTFKWKFGDGDSTVQVVPSGGDTTYTTVTHTYPPGTDTFTVQLFVTSDTVCGQGSAGRRLIFSLQRPTARFGYQTSCGQLSVPFTDSSLANGIPSLSYNWRFLDKNNVLLGTSTLQNPSFTYPGFDTVRAQLIVSGGGTCTRPDTLSKTIVLKAKPVASFTYTNICGSLSALFTNISTIPAGSIQSSIWLLGDGSNSTAQNPIHTYSSFGTYTAKLVATSTAGCTSDSAVQTIFIKAKPVARISYDTNTCAASPLLLRDSSFIVGSTLQSLYWAVPALNLSSNLPFIQPVFTTGGSYTVLHALTSAQGCTSDTLSQNIFIESLPVAATTAPANGCTGESLTFTSSSTIAFGNIDSLRWQVSNNPSISQNSTAPFTYIFPTAGSYTVRLQAVSSHGCLSNTATQTVTIESKPVADFTNSLLCPGRAVVFTNGSTAGTGTISSSQWRINNSAVATVSGAGDYSYTFSRGGTYTVQLTVTTAGGCSSTITKNILVEPAIASAGRDTTVREGEPFTLQGSGGTAYLWQPPNGLDDASKEKPVGLLNSSQQYTLQVTTAQGCIGVDTVLVTVLRNLKIANAFSPNGDGINDEWRIDQLRDYPNAQLQLFDRYGQIVYTAKGNGITGWKGTAGSNKPVAVGAYYYIITLNSALNSKPYTGWVMVVR